MQGTLLVLSGVLGAVAGSFFSALLHRLPRGQDVVFRRSYCPSCKKTLGVRELIPLLSFLWQRGRCRSCKVRIPLRYPFLELFGSVVFMIFAFSCADAASCFYGYPLPVGWFFIGLLLFIGIFDYFFLLIPDLALSLGIIAALGARLWFFSGDVAGVLLGAVIGGGLFWLLVRISRERWMGMGDAKLGAIIGVLLGPKGAALTIFGASVIGGCIGMALLLLGKKRVGDQIPFGPLLVAAALLVVFYQPATDRFLASLLLL